MRHLGSLIERRVEERKANEGFSFVLNFRIRTVFIYTYLDGAKTDKRAIFLR